MNHIIFLDGDGTLWYPSRTKRTQATHWIYYDPETKDNFLPHLELCPSVYEALSVLYEKGFILILISMSPQPPEEAAKEHKQKLDYFDLTKFFTAWYSAIAGDPEGKKEIMKDVLKNYDLPVEQATMIGDSIKYDYQPACELGVQSYLIESDVSPDADNTETDTFEMQTISEVYDVLSEWNLIE